MDLFSETRRPGPRLRPPCRAGEAGPPAKSISNRRAGREASVLKAIVASCLFHALLLGSIIFSFNVRPWNPRPFFVFLGSILQEQDFLVSHLDHALAAVDIPVYETSVLLTGRTSPVVLVEKPSFSSQLRSLGKVVWKPLLAQGIGRETQEGGSASESDLRGDLNKPAYAPLRLSPSSPKLWDLRRGRGQ